MKKEDYPILYKMASDASAKYQKAFFALLGAYLLVLCVSGILESFVKNQLAFFIPFLISFVLFVLLQQFKLQEKWYRCRAAAESVKCFTWCWMMGSDPFSRGNTDEKFKEHVRAMYKDVASLIRLPENCDADNGFITEKMRHIRNAGLDEKKTFYKESRYENQKKWYAQKGAFNEKKHKQSLVLFYGLYIVVLGIFFYNVMNGKSLPTSYMLVFASAIVTWMEAKRFGDLRTAYTVTSCDIQMMDSADGITDEKGFAKYVKNCENAFSREHVRWAARAS